MAKINILIIDDQSCLRTGLRFALEGEPFIDAVYEAECERDALHAVDNHKIDVILLDIKLKESSGLDLYKKIKKRTSQPHAIAFTGLEGDEVILNLLKAGIKAVVHKLDTYDELLRAINNVMLVGGYFTQSVLKIVQANEHRWDRVPPVELSTSEKDFLKVLMGGKINTQIAEDFKMTVGGMEKFRSRLFKKVGVANAPALVAYAFRNGIL